MLYMTLVNLKNSVVIELIGEDISGKLDIVPVVIRVLRHIRPFAIDARVIVMRCSQ